MAYSQSPYNQPYEASSAPGSNADYYGANNTTWPAPEAQAPPATYNDQMSYYAGQYAQSGPPAPPSYGYGQGQDNPYPSYHSPPPAADGPPPQPHAYQGQYASASGPPPSSLAPAAGGHYPPPHSPGSGFGPSYQEDLSAHMANTYISGYDAHAVGPPHGPPSTSPIPGHPGAPRLDNGAPPYAGPNNPAIPGDDQRGMGSMVAGGVVGGLGVYAAQKIHKRYGSSSPSPPPTTGIHSSGEWPLKLAKGSTITFDHFPNGMHKDKKMGKIFSYSVVEPGTPASQPYYSYTFVNDKRWKKHPGLWVSQHKHRDFKDSRYVCKATYRSDGPKVEIWHPWTDWDGKWDPQREVWLSDTGTLNGQEFIWDYHWEDRPKRDKKAWHTIRLQYADDEAEEVCRITMYQIDHGKIEIPADIIKSQEGLDEMVSNACIQIQRWQNEWAYAPEDV